ncbi:Hsp70 family protein [Glycomyces salinus]|uniref:Hsp70 family protein n=1 Tax=Glycomyces salinus TaxID=980294 RepID=UPI0027DA4F7B|nr:Hsp70 family protein [Glycomyces salinus]
MSTSGWLLAVDIGTSNTVAALSEPDGHRRSLLFDGSPVLPSAVFLESDGTFHVGGDAQRMAQLDPARFEPNPKRRIGAGEILLGEDTVPVAEVLAQIFGRVATAAREAAGALPPVVLTYPAGWGPVRRSLLIAAARQAQLRPVKLVAEPIAAACYFTDHPDAGTDGPLAVFDLGGGTVDVAILDRSPEGGFIVVAHDGLDDRGGLDIDHALVGHLGTLIAEDHPEVWGRLSLPLEACDRRNRQLFWNDVRDAKAMLSRAATPPIAVPGVDAALHLTREEVERLAEPILNDAVTLTGRLIERTCRSAPPGEVALVGGASRMPLVGRLLHTRLGLVPLGLEHPELPVAHGSLLAPATAEIADAEEATPAPPVLVQPSAPGYNRLAPQAAPTGDSPTAGRPGSGSSGYSYHPVDPHTPAIDQPKEAQPIEVASAGPEPSQAAKSPTTAADGTESVAPDSQITERPGSTRPRAASPRDRKPSTLTNSVKAPVRSRTSPSPTKKRRHIGLVRVVAAMVVLGLVGVVASAVFSDTDADSGNEQDADTQTATEESSPQPSSNPTTDDEDLPLRVSSNSTMELEGHAESVSAVALGEFEGRPVALTASEDHTARVWDLDTGETQTVLEGHTDWVNAVALGELDGRPVALTASLDYTVRVWDLDTGDARTVFDDDTYWVRAVALGEFGGRPVAVGQPVRRTASEDHTVRVWDLDTGETLTVLEGHTNMVNAVAWGELDGRPVALTASNDHTTRVWEFEIE